MADVGDTEVEAADAAGSSLTFPKEAGSCKKGDYLVIKGKACKIVEVTTSKTGKHGHAKAHIVGIGVFDGRKYEEIAPTSATLEAPYHTKKDYSVMDLVDDMISLLDEQGHEKSDVPLPEGDMLKTITAGLEKDKEMNVTVFKALGIEQIIQVKEG